MLSPRKVTLGCFDTDPGYGSDIEAVINSGWISPGEKVLAFEEAFAKAHDCKYGVMVSSGTDALRIALGALKEIRGWEDGDEVIVPALTFIATANVVLQNGLKPVFVDVDPFTFNIDPDLVESTISPMTKAIMPVHLFGKMANMPMIQQAAKGLAIIEDSCEAAGIRRICNWGPETGISKEDRRKLEVSVGSFSDIACFSTYACHLINTGVGGMALTNDIELYDLMRSLLNHGRRSEAREDRFTFDRLGYSCRPTEFQAVIGLRQLAQLKGQIAKRRVNASLLNTELLGTDDWLQRSSPIEVNSEHAWMMYPLLLTDKTIDRDEFCMELEKKGIETRPFFPLLVSPLYRRMFPNLAEQFPVALNASKRGFYVGCHQQMSVDDLTYLADSIKGVYSSLKKGVLV